MIDFFEWDRRALPVVDVHVDSGPLTREHLGDWVFRATNMSNAHPSGPYIREAAYAFASTLPRGSLLLYFYN